MVLRCIAAAPARQLRHPRPAVLGSVPVRLRLTCRRPARGGSCVARALDRLYGLYGGATAEDLFCPASSLVCRVVHELAQVTPPPAAEDIEQEPAAPAGATALNEATRERDDSERDDSQRSDSERDDSQRDHSERE